MFKRVSFFFKVLAGCAVVVAVLAGYVRLRIERFSVAYETSENIRTETKLVEEVDEAELRYNKIFSSKRLGEAAKKRGFREPRHSDFIYESENGDGGAGR